jgi:hypothetical protein
MRARFATALRLLCLLGAAGGAVCAAAGQLDSATDADAAAGPDADTTGGFLGRWFALSDAAKESQPHWMTPLVTVTPRLEQEFRYDQSWQSRPGGVELNNYGNGKGLELIPAPDTEIILGVPAYEVRQTRKGSSSGWADETLLLKYRVLSANEENGNFIVTGFLGASVPSGGETFTNNASIITPTLAAGKGWGSRAMGFDVQTTLGVAIPLSDEHAIGTTTTWNTSLQAHVLDKLWPEIEATYTSYQDGPHSGKTQFALTAGIVLGRFDLGARARLILGGGYQWPLTNFRTFNDSWLATARVAF